MRLSADALTQEILGFMSVLYRCHSDTKYAEDRAIYAKDIVVAMGWIVELSNGVSAEDVRLQILSPQTDKYFGDYWRQGEWGERALNALMFLKKKL